MSLKVFLFLAPVALGGYYVASRHDAASPGSAQTAKAATKAAAPRRSEQECRQLEQRMLEDHQVNAPTDNPIVAMRDLNGMYRELQRQGCDPGGRLETSFEAPSNRMGAAPPGGGGPRADGTSFEPGRPMVDLGRNRAR